MYKSCGCPYGCCDCGTEYVYFNRWRNKIETFYGSNRRLPKFYEFLGEL